MRYAIYFTPKSDSELWRFGSCVLGYDAYSACDVRDARIGKLQSILGAATSGPRRYGFHATLKAPFHLATGVSEDQLVEQARLFARRRKCFVLPPLTLGRLESFLALRPRAPEARLNRLAADCVVEFDALRAPLLGPDRERRLKAKLTERQTDLLERWGYPFVLEEFRFHMTLTGNLAPEQLSQLEASLLDLYEPLAEPVAIDAISIMRQETREQTFRVLERCPLV